MTTYHQRWAEANAEHLRAYRAAYYRKNKAKWRARSGTSQNAAYRRAYKARTKDRQNELRRAARARDPERIRLQERTSRARNRERVRAQDRRWKEANPEKAIASVRKAKLKKPDLYRAHAVQGQARRRARRKAAPAEHFTSAQIYSRDRNICHLCRSDVTPSERSIDHLIPIARGGAHARWNVATAHLKCNQRRNVRQILFPENRERAEIYLRSRIE